MWRTGERRNTNKRSIQISHNQPAVPVAMLQQMLEVMAARFHAVTQTFALLIDSVIDDILLQTGPLGNQTSLEIVQVSDRRLVHSILHHTPDLVVYRVEVWNCGKDVWRPQVWGDELRRWATEKVDGVASMMCQRAILLEDKVISSDLSYCRQHVFHQQLIIGAIDLSPGAGWKSAPCTRTWTRQSWDKLTIFLINWN